MRHGRWRRSQTTVLANRDKRRVDDGIDNLRHPLFDLGLKLGIDNDTCFLLDSVSQFLAHATSEGLYYLTPDGVVEVTRLFAVAEDVGKVDGDLHSCLFTWFPVSSHLRSLA